jgi:signal transduction histidine kinase
VFERFFRGLQERHQRTPGAGLGLYLAKAIIEAHGGRIWVESKPGEGATFFFAIPLNRQEM